jgi:hypothetical protein
MDNLFDKRPSANYLEGKYVPSVIQSVFMYAYPDEELWKISEKHVTDIEFRMHPIYDLPNENDITNIFLEEDVSHGGYAYSWDINNHSVTRIRSGRYILSYDIYYITCDISFVTGGLSDMEDISLIRLTLFLYLIANRNCGIDFSSKCPIWFYDPYNLKAVLYIFSNDIERGYYDVLEGFLKYMDKYGIELRDIVEACQEHGYMELLMQVMRILGEKPKEQERLRL